MKPSVSGRLFLAVSSMFITALLFAAQKPESMRILIFYHSSSAKPVRIVKQNVFLNSLLLLLCVILLSCSQKENAITTFADRTYTGKYRIEDGSYLQYGLVTLIFHETHYEQHGFVEYPSSGEFQSEGSFSVQGNTVIFNPACDEWSMVSPSWFLCGEFTFNQVIDSTTFQ